MYICIALLIQIFTGSGPENTFKRGPVMGTFRSAGVQQRTSTQTPSSVSQGGSGSIAQRVGQDSRLRNLLEDEVAELDSAGRSAGG